MRELPVVIRVIEVPSLILSRLDFQLSFRVTAHVLSCLTLHFVNCGPLLYFGHWHLGVPKFLF